MRVYAQSPFPHAPQHHHHTPQLTPTHTTNQTTQLVTHRHLFEGDDSDGDNDNDTLVLLPAEDDGNGLSNREGQGLLGNGNGNGNGGHGEEEPGLVRGLVRRVR